MDESYRNKPRLSISRGSASPQPLRNKGSIPEPSNGRVFLENLHSVYVVKGV